MYIAMNRFRVNEGHEKGFERVWRQRNSYLDEVPGFVAFKLLRGRTGEGLTTYVSHSSWETEAAFLAWTESPAFAKAHQKGRSPPGTLAGPPAFEGYQVVLSQ